MSEANKMTMESTIGQLYATPIGHDTMAKVVMQLGAPEVLLQKGPLANMKLKTLAGIAEKVLGEGFFDALLHLVNSEKDMPIISKGKISHKWWKEAVFYQIYPRSFYDTDGDGIGDLRGIIEKLDYLEELGVTALWLSPIYDSPNDDNGYDIRDYHKIMEEFGTMEDFEELLSKVHEKGMKLIMDLVINHTSDEHKWFREALKDPDSKYRNYYHLRKGDGSDNPPNNWTSFFSGSAWNHYKESDEWALHLFSRKQMDLNWDNPQVREDLVAMINWWLDKGVDGFRMDVINYISKEPELPQGNTIIGKMMGYTGIENYYYGPNLHKYLRQVRAEAFDKYGAFSVGETPGVGINMCRLLTGEERKELDMVFSFDHLETPGHVRMEDYEYDLNYYRDYICEWVGNYGNNCWMSLFYNNHDNPRMISKVTKDAKYYPALSKLLAVMQLTMKGTPFIFQGEEMGLSNYRFTSMEQITDVEAKGYYQELLDRGKTPGQAFATILAGTREHCRVLLPWNEKLPSYHDGLKQEINEDVQEAYRQLIALRKADETLVYGDFKILNDKRDRFTYSRGLNGRRYIIDCNLGQKKQKAYQSRGDYELVYASAEWEDGFLQPYEARIWRKK
ncbi:MAG: alpha-glucosidase [Lachnospiraceae bacterium]|nr:alpha-glucosidase [Lachnospiraceae bacterium]